MKGNSVLASIDGSIYSGIQLSVCMVQYTFYRMTHVLGIILLLSFYVSILVANLKFLKEKIDAGDS